MTVGRDLWRSHRRGLLLAVPGLVPPLVLFAVCVRFLIPELGWYYSLAEPERGGFAGFGLYLLSIGIGASLLLCLPPLLIALPTRLHAWHCIVAMVLQAFGLYLAGASFSWLGVAVLVYVPALMVYRLLQARDSKRSTETHLTGAST